MEKRKSSNFGVFIILVGIAILLINMNVLKIGMFWGIIDLWPILLIIIGLSMILRRVKYVPVVLWLLFIGLVVAYSYLNIDQKSWSFGSSVSHITESQSMSPSEKGQILLDIRQGSLDITTNDQMISYTVPDKNVENSQVKTNGNLTELIIEDDHDIDIINNFQKRSYEIDMIENDEMSFSLDGGIILGEIDFSNVAVNGFDLDLGIGELDISFGQGSYGTYDINVGVGDIKLDIPQDIGVKIIKDGGLTSVSLPSYFNESDDVYTSENYGSTEFELIIYVDLGIGSLEID